MRADVTNRAIYQTYDEANDVLYVRYAAAVIATSTERSWGLITNRDAGGDVVGFQLQDASQMSALIWPLVVHDFPHGLYAAGRHWIEQRDRAK